MSVDCEYNTQSQETDDKINYIPNLITFTEHASNLHKTQYIQLLTKFIELFDTKSMTNIISTALLNMQSSLKYQYLSFLNENVIDLLPQKQQTTNSHSLLCLNADTITSISQFLSLKELSNLEICNKFFFKTIRKSPHSITSLNYPEWLKYFMSPQMANIHRLSSVKKLYFNAISSWKRCPKKCRNIPIC